jgi:hypothetical protein
MKKLLSLKHWQLFILIIIPVLFTWCTTLLTIVTDAYYAFFMISSLIAGLCSTYLLFAWLYILGTHICKKLPSGVNMNLRRFKTLLLIPCIYIALLIVLIPALSDSGRSSESTGMLMALVIVPMHLFSMVCMMYSFYFNAKALKSAELQRSATFGEYIGEFFLIWFFPIIGIWILQPRINKLFEQKAEDESWLPASE